ncbi:hypothetical protein LTR67_008069 [Exophiala xenobiotica]
MAAVRFAAEKLYGSVWHFTPTDLDASRSIHVHEPHPTGKTAFYKARKLGARLHRTHSWTGEVYYAQNDRGVKGDMVGCGQREECW